VLDRLGELTSCAVGLEILILGTKQFRMETNKLSRPHGAETIIVYRDGIEVVGDRCADGSTYGQIYAPSLNVLVVYSQPRQQSAHA